MKRVSLLCLVILVTACAANASPGTPPGDLESARQLWSSAGPDGYRFIFENDCGECLPSSSEPREVLVRDGAAASPDDPTVETLFQTIEEAIAAGSTVEVSYHAELGHPTDIWIDRDARAYDGGTHWLIRELEPLD